MGVFQFFKIVHMVLNRATHHLRKSPLSLLYFAFLRRNRQIIQIQYFGANHLFKNLRGMIVLIWSSGHKSFQKKH